MVKFIFAILAFFIVVAQAVSLPCPESGDPENCDPAKNYFKKLDKDGDGKVSFDEYYAFFQKTGRPGAGPEIVREMFDKHDTNKDGFLSPEEVAQYQPGI